MAIDTNKPADDVPVSDLPRYIRETRANLKVNLVQNAIFESGTVEGDAVYFDAHDNIWRRSLADDPQRGSFFGVAFVEEGAVQTSNYVEGPYSFVAGQSVYVSSATVGKFSTTETGIVAGRALSTNSMLIDAMTSVVVTEVQEEVQEARNGETSLANRLNAMDQLRDQTAQEVHNARGIAANLNARISVALNQDGTLKTTVVAMAWAAETEVFSRAGSMTFLIVGIDKSAVYVAGRAVRFNSSDVAYVASVSYNAADTIVNITGNTIPTTLAYVEYGLDSMALPRISHNALNAVDGADPASSDGTKNKHVSNLQSKLWTDHVNVTAGNPHGTTAEDVGADPSGTAINAANAAVSAHNAGTDSHGLNSVIWPLAQGGLGQAFASLEALKTWLGIGAAFPSGTRMLFQQSTAPTGWTKDTSHHDKALRVVNGTVGIGGSVGFSTLFGRTATDAFTLTTAHMPFHGHNFAYAKYSMSDNSSPRLNLFFATGGPFVSDLSLADPQVDQDVYVATAAVVATGSGGAHSHGLDLRLAYVDIIIAQKD